MVTAETALALPALVVLLGGLLTVIVAVTSQLRCVAAAREGARAAARGESPAVVQQIAVRAAPDSAAVSVTGGSDTVTVTVRATVRPLGIRLGQITVSGTATAQREPTSDSDAAGPAAAWLLLLGGSRRGWRRRRTAALPRDRGSGTVYAAALAGVLIVITAAAAIIGKAHVAHRRAASAADLAALAAAQVLVDGSGDPCARATSVAGVNGAGVTACAIEGETVLITTSVPVDLGGLGLLDASASARAGPVP